MDDLMPAIFIGHGNPMNALHKNEYTKGWASIGKAIPRPQAILCISAHYYIPFCMVTSASNPPTIHDFSGFPKELYQIAYPAPGSPELAHRVTRLIQSTRVRLDESWGFDHGTWSVLTHLFPDADIPVVQLSIDETRPAMFHYEMGRELMALREEGIFIIGSGNIVHNLSLYNWKNRNIAPYEWAVRFEKYLREMILAGDDDPLIHYEKFGEDALLSVPIPDHYLPFLYILGLRKQADQVTFPVRGVDGGSVSMLAVQIG